MKHVIDILKSSNSMLGEDLNNKCRSKCIVSTVLCFSALIMLIMNLINHSMIMAYSSMVLVGGFAISAIMAGVFKNQKASAVIIALLVAFVLSVFAVTGGNEGFAILWILLVPLFAINVLGVYSGLFVSTYFLIFLFVLFFTPLNVYVIEKYTGSFVSKFPILYMCDYLIATFFSLQREYYHRSLKMQVYTDGLTSAYNRKFYMESLKGLNKDKNSTYGIVMADLNGLKVANDTLGHDAGDELIMGMADCCLHAFDKKDIVCRIGGDEFAVISFGSRQEIEAKIDKLKATVSKWKGKYSKNLSFAMGFAYSLDNPDHVYEDLMKIADSEMYKNKASFYMNKENNRRKR